MRRYRRKLLGVGQEDSTPTKLVKCVFEYQNEVLCSPCTREQNKNKTRVKRKCI